MNIYRTALRLGNSQVNLHRRLRTSVLFGLLQDTSIRHTEELGMGREKTLDRGLLWVVTLQHAEIIRMPEYDEEITVETWPGLTMHLLFPRYYLVLDSKGSELIRASSLWALVDSNSRRMVFPDPYGIRIEGFVRGCETVLPSPPRRAEGENISLFRVPFSYVDLNGHMNNTRYFDLAEDLIPAAAEGKSLLSVDTEYASEACLGEELRITLEPLPGGWRVSGDAEKKIFRMQFLYRQ